MPENFRHHTSGTGQIFAVRRARALPLLVQREEQLEELARRAAWSGVREARWRRSECTAFARGVQICRRAAFAASAGRYSMALATSWRQLERDGHAVAGRRVHHPGDDPERHNQSDLAGMSGLSGLSGRGRWQVQRDADTLLPAERLDARCGQPGLEARGQQILIELAGGPAKSPRRVPVRHPARWSKGSSGHGRDPRPGDASP
jgi:hypothetical protein